VLRPNRDAVGEITDWLILLANAPLGQMLNVASDRLIGRLASSVLPGWEVLGIDDDCRSAAGGIASLERDLSLEVSGVPHIFRVHTRPIEDGCVVRFADVSAIRQRERALRADAARLKADNSQLMQLASIDGLTGLSNRRALDSYLDREMADARRSGESLAVALCDIDHFKAFNDLYGHLTGDDALCEVAAALAAAGTRAGDMVARFGGEEFVLVMRRANVAGAREVVQRARNILAQRAITHVAGTNGGWLTLSSGIAQFDPGADTDATALLARADAALYRAKQQGRNRIEIAD
jgi:diguanylate cyclase (GGDEF)-like protein